MGLPINWEKLTTMAIWSAFMGMLTLAVGGTVFYWETGELSESYYAHLEVSAAAIQTGSRERGLILDALEDLKANQQKAERRAMVIIGLGGQGSFGTDSPYVRININSNASSYAEESLVRITNLAVEGTPSSDMAIDGTFTNSNSNLKVMFSRRAADDLEIQGRMEIKLEPVIEETQ